MAMRAVWLVTLPMAAGLLALATPLCRYLYGEAGAAPALEVLALGTGFLALQQVLGNALQAAGMGWAPVANLLIGAAVKFSLAWWLVPIWGIRGAAASTVIAAVVTTLLNWRAWRGRVGTPARSPWATAIVPGVAAVLMAVVVRLYLLTVHVTPVSTLAAIGLGAGLYLGLIVAGGERRFLRALWNLR
jgi:O-antigen/teichoic acid export membrane protein